MADDDDDGTIDLKALNDDEESGNNNNNKETKQRGVSSFGGGAFGEWFNPNNYEQFEIVKSMYGHRPLSFVGMVVSFLFLFFLIPICTDVYEGKQRNAIIDNMKTEIDPERIYAQEVVKKATAIIGSYVYSEFLIFFFFGNLFLTILLCCFTAAYMNEKWRIQRRIS